MLNHSNKTRTFAIHKFAIDWKLKPWRWYISIANKKHYMDKFSYSLGLGSGQNLSSMGIGNRAVDDFAQAIKDVLEGN